MTKEHHYHTRTTWVGANDVGTTDYRAYGRDHVITADGKPAIPASADPAFRGDASRYNPEDMLVAATSACHMLWYLHLAAVNKVVVKGYVDDAEGVMSEGADGAGAFTKIILRPTITITAESDVKVAESLHAIAHEKCFIANTLKCPVTVEPTFERE